MQSVPCDLGQVCLPTSHLPHYPLHPPTHLHPIYSLHLPNYPPSIVLSPTPTLQPFLSVSAQQPLHLPSKLPLPTHLPRRRWDVGDSSEPSSAKPPPRSELLLSNRTLPPFPSLPLLLAFPTIALDSPCFRLRTATYSLRFYQYELHSVHTLNCTL